MSLLKISSVFTILLTQILSQQINHPNGSQLNWSDNSPQTGWLAAPQWTPGPFTVHTGLGPGNFVTMTQGLQGVYFETYVSDGPPISANLPNGNTVHLNPLTMWDTRATYSGTTPCNQSSCPTPQTGPWGASATAWPYDSNAMFDFTVQSWVTDPTIFLGWRLTAAIHVIR